MLKFGVYWDGMFIRYLKNNNLILGNIVDIINCKNFKICIFFVYRFVILEMSSFEKVGNKVYI